MMQQPDPSPVPLPEYSLRLSQSIYPATAVMAASYWFTERFYVHIEDCGKEVIVRLNPKNEEEPNGFEKEFLNRVLDCAIRERIAAETEQIRNAILAHALSATPLLGQDLDSADVCDDPLAIK